MFARERHAMSDADKAREDDADGKDALIEIGCRSSVIPMRPIAARAFNPASTT
jgi:hypothetical protein